MHRSLVTIIAALACTLAFASCGSKHESAVKKQIKLMNEYADVYEKDPKSSKLADIDKEIEELGEEMNSMSDPSDAKAKKMVEKYASDIAAASMRYAKAKMGPAAAEGMKALEGLDVEKMMRDQLNKK